MFRASESRAGDLFPVAAAKYRPDATQAQPRHPVASFLCGLLLRERTPLPRLRSNCPPLDGLGTLASVIVMPNLVVMLGPRAPVADVDTDATLMFLVLAAGVGGFSGGAWSKHDTGDDRTDRVVQRRRSYGPRAEGLAALVSHTHVVVNNMEDQGQPIERSLMDVVRILPPARQAGVARGLTGAPWRSDP